MHSGTGSFVFNDAAAGDKGSLQIHYYRPAKHGCQDRILVVMSGMDRAAAYFRDCWIPYAEKLNVLVVAPEFDEDNFPGALKYNYGNVGVLPDSHHAMNSRDVWTFGILDRLFHSVKASTSSERSSFSLFGHSAGAQFAHRYLALMRTELTDLVIAANAGWYMVPDGDAGYPAGVAGTDFNEEDMRRYLASQTVILLGDADINENEEGLPQNPEAVAQGAHRLARGTFYFNHCKAVAGRSNAVFGWRLVIASGVGHDDAEVAAAAAEVLESHKPQDG